jgi:hypothetical protein
MSLLVVLTSAAVYGFRGSILHILGNNYLDLEFELLLKFAEAGINLIAGVFFMMLSARGWALNPLILIPVNITTMLVLALVNDVSTLVGVLVFGLEFAVVGLACNGAYLLAKIRRAQARK